MTEKQLEMAIDLPDPYSSEDLLKKYTVFVKFEFADFLERLSGLKNDLAERNAEEAGEGVSPSASWSLKKVTEAAVKIQVEALQAQLAPMIKECGPMPPVDDKAARKKYADRVQAWLKK